MSVEINDGNQIASQIIHLADFSRLLIKATVERLWPLNWKSIWVKRP